MHKKTEQQAKIFTRIQNFKEVLVTLHQYQTKTQKNDSIFTFTFFDLSYIIFLR